MLNVCFSIFDGLSTSAEQRLWERGILTWAHFFTAAPVPLSARKAAHVADQIPGAEAALAAGLADWFLNRLSGMSRVRVYPHFRDAIRYLDIETTGLGPDAVITSIAVYDGRRLNVFVQGVNLHDFPRALAGAKLLVTFNGARFDLPILRRSFRLDLAMPHLDLLPVTKAFGYHGGLKARERQMGIKRQLDGDIDGKAAVDLWYRYADHRDMNALARLAAYNCEDVISLESILVRLYNHEMAAHPLFKKVISGPRPDVNEPFDSLFDN